VREPASAFSSPPVLEEVDSSAIAPPFRRSTRITPAMKGLHGFFSTAFVGGLNGSMQHIRVNVVRRGGAYGQDGTSRTFRITAC